MKVNQDLATQQANIQKDLNITFPAMDAYQFLVDTIKNAKTLDRLQPLYKDVPSGNIDALTVGSRRLRLADDSDGDTSTPADGITKRQTPYSVKKVFWDTWLKNDDVVYNAIRRTNSNSGIGFSQEGITPSSDLETVSIQMIQKQFGMDLQDLAFNGNVSAAVTSGDPDADFLGILDGFVKKSLSTSYITDLLTDEPTIAAFVQHIQMLDEKYTSNFGETITWFMKKQTHDKLVGDLTSRQTALGDTVIKDGVIMRIAGYDVEIVSGLQGPYVDDTNYNLGRRGWVGLTPWSNLTPILTQAAKYKREGSGSTAAKKDSTYHIIFAYMDVVIKEVDAVAVMLGDNL